jgi:hypothetical protein
MRCREVCFLQTITSRAIILIQTVPEKESKRRGAAVSTTADSLCYDLCAIFYGNTETTERVQIVWVNSLGFGQWFRHRLLMKAFHTIVTASLALSKSLSLQKPFG